MLDAESETIDKSKVPISNLYKIMDTEKRHTKKQDMGFNFKFVDVPSPTSMGLPSIYAKNISNRGIDMKFLLRKTRIEHKIYHDLVIIQLNRPNLFDDEVYEMFKNRKYRNYLFFGEEPPELPKKIKKPEQKEITEKEGKETVELNNSLGYAFRKMDIYKDFTMNK